MRRVTAYWDEPMLPNGQHILATERGPTRTGLVDQHGVAIMRAPRPIGFGRDIDCQPYILEWPH